MRFFVSGHYDKSPQSPLFSPLSSSPITSESSFGGTSRRNSSEEPTSPATPDYQLPSRSQSIFTPSPNINNANSNTSDIQTLDSTFMPAAMPVPVSVLPSPSQPTIQLMQPNTFMPFMSSMSTMPPMINMPNMQTMTYNDPNALTSPLDSPPTDFIDTLFSSCPPLEHPVPVPHFTQNCEDMLFDLDEIAVWNATLVPTLAPQSPEELYASPTQERVTAQLETYFRCPDQQRLRRTLESIQGASWLVAHQKEPNDSTTKRSVYLAFLSNKGDGKASNGSNGNNYRCLFDGCNKSFDRQDRAIGHIRMHFEHRPFQCNTQCGVADCPERFYCTSYLKSHIKRQKVPCESCGVSFFRNAIKRHKVNCSGRQGLWPWFETQNHNTQEVDRNLKQF
ncbi:hypothetical protein CPB86DRAFT_145987 [Serendipita vermifera]|nr:hypothetical protein CPB86DRAFT_145987 [Serendipita vermifera]